MNILKQNKYKKIISYLMIAFGVFIVSFGYYFILLPTKMVTGGMMGVSIILEKYIDPVIFLYASYVVLLITGGLVLGKEFFFRSVFGTILQPTIVLLFRVLKLDSNMLINCFNEHNVLVLSCVIAALFTGLGNGILFRNNATTGGMDVIQKIMVEKLHISPSIAMYGSDGLIIIIGCISFGIENTIFAIISMYICGKVLDYVILGTKKKNACYIISKKHELIKEYVYKNLDRGITEEYIRGGYLKEESMMLMCILSNKEYVKLKEEVLKIDNSAFLFVVPTNEVYGKGFSSDKIPFIGTN